MTNSISNLAIAISNTITSPGQALFLRGVYSETQKVDSDGDLDIEPTSEGFVDLFDFARRASQRYTDPAVIAAANDVMTRLQTVVVAEQHRSGNPWIAPNRLWNLDNVRGLSIFLPLGENMQLHITGTSTITPGLVVVYDINLRDLYSSNQLEFVGATAWRTLINAYYDMTTTVVPTGTIPGPVGGLLVPDVTPPHTVMTPTGAFTVGETISLTWTTTDTESGLASITLWHQPPRPPNSPWMAVTTQTLTSSMMSGVFSFTLTARCENGLALSAADQAGNVEPLGNTALTIKVLACEHYYLPIVFRDY